MSYELGSLFWREEHAKSKQNKCPGPWGWNNGVRHSNDVLQARANVKNNKYKDVYGIVHKAFAPAIAGMSGQIHADFLRLLWVDRKSVV